MRNIDINEETETVQKIITNFSDMKFTLIPVGEFMMGSEETDEEKPVHKVTISKPFYLGRMGICSKSLHNNTIFSWR